MNDEPEDGIKIIPLKTLNVFGLSRYAYKVACLMHAEEFSSAQEKRIKECYLLGWHPGRVADELMETVA